MLPCGICHRSNVWRPRGSQFTRSRPVSQPGTGENISPGSGILLLWEPAAVRANIPAGMSGGFGFPETNHRPREEQS